MLSFSLIPKTVLLFLKEPQQNRILVLFLMLLVRGTPFSSPISTFCYYFPILLPKAIAMCSCVHVYKQVSVPHPTPWAPAFLAGNLCRHSLGWTLTQGHGSLCPLYLIVPVFPQSCFHILPVGGLPIRTRVPWGSLFSLRVILALKPPGTRMRRQKSSVSRNDSGWVWGGGRGGCQGRRGEGKGSMSQAGPTVEMTAISSRIPSLDNQEIDHSPSHVHPIYGQTGAVHGEGCLVSHIFSFWTARRLGWGASGREVFSI